MRGRLAVILEVLALVECSGSRTQTDAGIVEDQATRLDQALDAGVPDHAEVDRPPADRGRHDSAKADHPRKDAAIVDLASGDLRKPDAAKPDAFKPDAAAPPPPWSPPKTIDANAAKEQELGLSIDAQGNVYAIWIDVGSITTDVVVRRRDLSTGSWTNPQIIDTSSAKEKGLRVAAGKAWTYTGWIEVSSISTAVLVSYFPYP